MAAPDKMRLVVWLGRWLIAIGENLMLSSPGVCFLLYVYQVWSTLKSRVGFNKVS